MSESFRRISNRPACVFDKAKFIDMAVKYLTVIVVIIIWTVPNYWIGKQVTGPYHTDNYPSTKFWYWFVGFLIMSGVIGSIVLIILLWYKLFRKHIDYCYSVINNTQNV
jgi:uncharacterized membrane protein